MSNELKAILIAEDDMETRQQYATFLRRRGYAVDETVNAEETLGAILANDGKYGLLLLDVLLPETAESTQATCQAQNIARELEKQTIFLPIKFMTNWPDEVSIKELQDFRNFDDYIVKPFRPQRLQQNVSDRIGQPSLQRNKSEDER